MSSETEKKVRKRRKSDTSLSKSAIVEASLKIIDRDGTESFSMRNLANELGVYPTAIYWHVANRNALIGEVISAVLVDLLPEDFEINWQQGILSLCRNYRERIKAHPNIAPLVGVQLVSNNSIDFNMVERILTVLEHAGFHGSDLRAAYNTVISAMVGYTTQEFALVPSDGKDSWAETMQTAVDTLDQNKFPTTARNLDHLRNKSFIMRWDNGIASPLDDGFELYITSIVKGLAIAAQELSLKRPHTEQG